MPVYLTWMEEVAWKRWLGGGSLEEMAWRRWLGRGGLEEARFNSRAG
jgi:hypothetical protein